MKEKGSALIYYLSVIFKWRRTMLKIFLGITVAAIIISLIIRPQYIARTTILPPNPQQDAMFGLMGGSLVGSLGGLSGLGSMLPGATTTSDLYAAILQSGNIMSKVIEKNNLKKVFKSKTIVDASKMLESITTIRVSPEGIIGIAVTWYDRELAAGIANSYAEELNRFNTEATMTVGKKYRLFIEQRLKETIDTLAKAEQIMRDFQELHRTVALDIEIENAIATIAKIKSEIILREVQRGAIASVSSANNPYVTNADYELRELRRQLSNIEFGRKDTTRKEYGAGFSIPFERLPAISLEYARLLRDVKVQEAIYELMTQQFEQAKIMEAKDTPTVQILDRASPPEKRAIPRRSRIVILAAFFSIILGISVSFFLEWFERVKTQPNEYAKLVDIYAKLKTDYNAVKIKVVELLHRRKSRTK